MNRRRTRGWLLVLGLVAAAYVPALDGDFLHDDYVGLQMLTEDGAPSLAKALTYFFPSHLTRDQFLRPVPVLTAAADLFFWRLNPVGFHLTNLLVHLLGSLAVGKLAARVARRAAVGPVAALLYGLYPGHAEAVAWVAHRMVGLTVVFYVLALLLHLRPAWRPVAWLAALLALLCKEPALNLPLVVLVLNWLHDRRHGLAGALRAALPYAAVVAVYLVWKALAFGRLMTGYGAYDTYLGYFMGEKVYRDVPMSLVRFLSPVNGEAAPAWMVPAHALLAAAGGLVLGGAGLRRAGPRRAVLFGAAVMVLSLGLVLPFLTVSEALTNSRHFSAPAVGLAVAAAALWGGLRRRGRLLAMVGLGLYCVPVVVNVPPYVRAGRLARAVRAGVQERLASYGARADKVVVTRVPSMVQGAPVFGDGTALEAACKPPYTERPHEIVAVLAEPPADADAVLYTLSGQGRFAVLDVVRDPAGGLPHVEEVSPPTAAWKPRAPERLTLSAPAFDARVRLADDPPFVFRSPEPFPWYRLVFRLGDRLFPVTAASGRQVSRDAAGRLVYHLSSGDLFRRENFLERPEAGATGPITWWVEGVRDYRHPRSAVVRSAVSRFRAVR